MNTQQVEYFLAVAKFQNFTEASRRLYVSQPSISRQIHLLEEEFETLLFSRDKSRVTLTKSGQILQQALLNCREEMDQCRHRIHNAADEKIVFRLAFQQGTGTEPFLMDILNKAFERFNDKIQLEIDMMPTANLRRALEEDAIDLAIMLEGEAVGNGKFCCEKFYEVPEAIVIGKKHPMAGRNNLTPKDFKKGRFVVSKNGSEYYQKHIEKICKTTGANPNQFKLAESIESMILYIESWKFAAMVPLGSRLMEDASIETAVEDVGAISIMGAWNKDNSNYVRDYIQEEIRCRKE